MVELFKLILVFVLIILLIQRKISIGLTILLGALFLGFLFKLSVLDLVKYMAVAAVEWPTLHLLIIVLLILIFGELLKNLRSLENLSSGLENLFRNTKLLLIFLPATVGLLPMPAGAMMSAPMVEEVGNRKKITPGLKMMVNYWFRHILEFIWPLYLGVILTASLLGIHYREVILAQLPLSLAMILGGILFCSGKIKVEGETFQSEKKFTENMGLVLKGIWPVLLVVGLNLIFRMDLALALGITIVFLAFTSKVGIKRFWGMIKDAVTLEMVVLIIAVMIFKKIITESGAIETIPKTIAEFGISPIFAIIIVPFTVGILTGMTSAFVGISYPILFSFLSPNGINYGYMMLAYGAGFAGVMLSPLHLCLIVTKNYFRVGFNEIYSMLLPASLFLIIWALVLVLLGFPWGKIG